MKAKDVEAAAKLIAHRYEIRSFASALVGAPSRSVKVSAFGVELTLSADETRALLHARIAELDDEIAAMGVES